MMAERAMSSLMPLAPKLVSPSCGIVKSLKRIHKDAGEPELPYIFRAELANFGFAPDVDFVPMVASGKGFSEDSAATGALGEAVERYCASVWKPSDITFSNAGDLSGRVFDPRDLVLYEDNQYQQLQKYAPYTQTSVLGWVQGHTWGRPEPIWLPAIGVYLSYQASSHDEFLCPVTSSGLACGPDVESALAKAACELIERESFMLMWHHRIQPTRLDLSEHPDRMLRALTLSYERRGVAMELYRLQSDLSIPVVMALGIQLAGTGPAVVVGLGADPSICAAARSAILEVAQVRPALRIRMRSPDARQRMADLVLDPMRVDSLEDHDLLYAAPQMLETFDFIRRQEPQEVCWQESLPAGPSAVATSLAASGLELHYVDVTPRDIEGLGLRTVRALIPDMQPIHFGAREIRQGGRRFYEIAAALLHKKSLSFRDLALMPHPLS